MTDDNTPEFISELMTKNAALRAEVERMRERDEAKAQVDKYMPRDEENVAARAALEKRNQERTRECAALRKLIEDSPDDPDGATNRLIREIRGRWGREARENDVLRAEVERLRERVSALQFALGELVDHVDAGWNCASALKRAKEVLGE